MAMPMRIPFADYFELTKPRVVALIVFTAVIGMFLAVPGIPPWQALVFGNLGIWLAASSAATGRTGARTSGGSCLSGTSERGPI